MADAYAFLMAEITPVSANNFIQFMLAHASNPPDRLVVAINSPGGNVISGITIYNTMRAMPYPIVTHNVGNVDSIANVIFLGGADRYACPAATFMFHGVGFNGNQMERLEEKNLREKLDVILSDHKRIANLIASRTQLTPVQGTRLFKEQRTRNAGWAHDKGLVMGIADFVLPAGTQPAIFT